MKQIIPILIHFLLLFSEKSFAQLCENDTVLYLIFDKDRNYFYDMSESIFGDTKEPIPERARYRYTEEYGPYNGHPLVFLSYKKDRSDTVSLNVLDHVPVVTIEQLINFTGLRGAKFLNQLKNIYLVEKFPNKGVASITKVRLDMSIE